MSVCRLKFSHFNVRLLVYGLQCRQRKNKLLNRQPFIPLCPFLHPYPCPPSLQPSPCLILHLCSFLASPRFYSPSNPIVHGTSLHIYPNTPPCVPLHIHFPSHSVLLYTPFFLFTSPPSIYSIHSLYTVPLAFPHPLKSVASFLTLPPYTSLYPNPSLTFPFLLSLPYLPEL